MRNSAIPRSYIAIIGLVTYMSGSVVVATELYSGNPVSPVEGALQNVSESSPQRAIGRLIEDVCPGTLTAGNQFNLDPNGDLKQRCDEMWANALIGNDIPGVTTGLQGTANEEDSAVASSEVDVGSSSTSKIQGRMNAVRGGSTSGIALTLNGLNGRFDDALMSALGAGDDPSTGWGGFFGGTYTNVDRDASDREAGFKSDIWGFTGGVDYHWTENLLLGVAFSYNEAKSDIAANGGRLDSDTWGVYGYGTYYPSNGTYIDYTIGYSDSSHDQRRNISYSIQQISLATLATTGPVALAGITTVNQVAVSDTDSDEFSVSATIGHDWHTNTVKFGPYAGVAYAETDIDGFRESMSNPTAAGSGLALFVDEQDIKSLITNVGAAATFTFQGPWGPVFPYLMGQYSHEFKNGNDPITGGFINDPNGLRFSLATDSPDRNYFNFGTGFSASLANGSYFYTRYNGLVGYRDLSVHSVEAGFLIAF